MVLLPDNKVNPETYNITFSVTDGSDPIEGATVTIGSITGTTGSAGGCTLQNVPAGSQTVTVKKAGYTDYSKSITVSEATTIDVTLSTS